MKRLLILLVGVLIVAGILYGLFQSTRPQEVEVVEAKAGTIRRTVDERAVTRLPQTTLVTMPFAGRIEPITLVEGTAVAKGEEVARIVPLDLALEVAQAEAVVQRLEEAIRQNADTRIERTTLDQAGRFVESMRATVESAAARVEAGQAGYDFAEKNLGRIRQLVSRGAGTQVDVDRAELDQVEASVALRQDQLVNASMVSMQAATDLMPTMVQQFIDRKDLNEAVLMKEKAEAEARLRQIQQQQERGTMQSPIDGIVLSRHATNEQFLQAGTVLLEIGDFSNLEVEVDVLSLDVVDITPGDPVEIHGPVIGPAGARGKVHRIHPGGFTKVSSLGVEQQRVKVIVRFTPDDLSRLRRERDLGVGYRLRASIITAEKANALVVPRNSLFRDVDGSRQLYVVRDGRARRQTVEVGMINDHQAEILARIEPGEPVVRLPDARLRDGMRVRMTERQSPRRDETINEVNLKERT